MTNLNHLFRKGISKFRNRFYDEASDYFEKIITLDPTDEESYYYLGLISLERNFIERAIDYFRSAIIINRKYKAAILKLGEIYEKYDYFLNAFNVYSEIKEEIPLRYASTWLFYIEQLLSNDDLETIISEVSSFWDFSKKYSIKFNEAQISRINGILDIIDSKTDEKNLKKINQNKGPKSFKKALEDKGIMDLVHITRIPIVPQILREGLKSRNIMKKLNKKIDSYIWDAQKKGEKNMKKNYRDDICDYVRLYFVSNTPMLRVLLFSRHQYHNIAILKIDPDIMDQNKKVYYTNKSTVKNDFKRFSSLNNLNQINWNSLMDDYEKYIAKYKDINTKKYRKFKGERASEVLIFREVPIDFIKPEIYVYSTEAKEKLNKYMKDALVKIRNYKIIVDKEKKYFPLIPNSKKYKKRIRSYDDND